MPDRSTTYTKILHFITINPLLKMINLQKDIFLYKHYTLKNIYMITFDKCIKF